MATFTPTTPESKTITTTTNQDAHTCKFAELTFLYDDDCNMIGVRGELVNFDSGGSRMGAETSVTFEVNDLGGTTPLADKLAEISNGTDDKGMTLEKAIIELLQSEGVLPSGTVG